MTSDRALREVRESEIDGRGGSAQPAADCRSAELLTQPPVTIGVLALQGAVEKHILMLGHCGVNIIPVRFARELDSVHGLIIPGGESTTVGKLMARYGIDEKIRERVGEGMSVFGTCTGMILLAKEIENSDQYRLGLMDAVIRRNAFGRQVDSFEADIRVDAVGEQPVRAVFIRAPYALSVGDDVEVLGRFEEKIILYRQGNLFASAFHPELTNDTRVHRLFIESIRSRLGAGPSSDERRCR